MVDVLLVTISLLLVGGATLAALSVFTWRHSELPINPLSVLLAAAALWVLSAAAEHLSPTIEGKMLATSVQFLGILALPSASVVTVLTYIGWRHWIQPFLRFAIPCAITCWALVITNDLHHVIWSSIELQSTGEIALLDLVYGPGFWLIGLLSHGQLVLAALLYFTQSWKHDWLERLLVLLGFSAPWLANLVYLTGHSPVQNFDITPFGLIVTGICFTLSFRTVGNIFFTVKVANREIVESIRDPILAVSDGQRLVSANESARAILAPYPLPAPVELVLAGQPELLRHVQYATLRENTDIALVVDGGTRIFDIRSMQCSTEQGNQDVTVFILRDVTSERAFENELNRKRHQLRQIIDLIPYPIYARDNLGRYLFVNEACATAYDLGADEIVGCKLEQLHTSKGEVEVINRSDQAVIDTGAPCTTEDEFTTEDGEVLRFKTTKLPFQYDESSQLGVVAVSVDVTREREREKMLQHMASTDPLTDLPNRRFFHELLSKALARATRGGYTAALLSLDLDRFKMVNDSYGHPTGDELLRQVAQRLLKNVRFSDSLASGRAERDLVAVSRLGGDEFMVLLPEISAPRDAALVARRIIDALMEPFFVGSNRLQLGTSIGIATCPEDGVTADALIRRSDQALSNAKSNRRGSFEFFNAELSATEERQHALEQALRRALDRREFVVHYQPIFETGSRKLSGAEALLRWHSAELGEVSPEEFIPVAEESGLIVKIGGIVFRMVCQQIAQWRERGLDVPRISVNLSARQLVDLEFQNQITSIMAATGVTGADFDFELTEGSMLADNPRAEDTLAWLKHQGMTLSLDDFGTGYSSLSLLRRLSFQRLKIDRSFVAGLGENSDDDRLVRGVIALAHRLNVETIAEGVESEGQLAILRSENCHYVQGFLLARPQTAQMFSGLLQAAPVLALHRGAKALALRD
ncbi:MAG: hypothetical protein CME59_06585 [Halioglobus sp.]|nr:hypothetical protein [Halioglobus sp.]